MKTKIAALAVFATAGTLLMPVTAAQAATSWCDPHSDEYAGACFTIGTVATHVAVVESVPLINGSSKTGSFHCAFSKTISKSEQVSGSVSEEAQVGIFGLADEKTTVSLSKSVTQTGEQATEAGASFTLKPHQQVTCERIYSDVVTTATENEYRGTTSNKTSHSVSIPSSLGIKVVD